MKLAFRRNSQVRRGGIPVYRCGRTRSNLPASVFFSFGAESRFASSDGDSPGHLWTEILQANNSRQLIQPMAVIFNDRSQNTGCHVIFLRRGSLRVACLLPYVPQRSESGGIGVLRDQVRDPSIFKVAILAGNTSVEASLAEELGPFLGLSPAPQVRSGLDKGLNSYGHVFDHEGRAWRSDA